MSNLTTYQQREIEVNNLVKERYKQLALFVSDKSTRNKYATAIVNIAMNKNLRDVSAESVVKTAFEIVQLGLNPNPLFGQAYVVPFKVKGVPTAQLQIGYKGYITLLKRAGWTIRAVAVYDVDDFEIKFAGLKDEINFTPNYEERQNDDAGWVYNHMQGAIVYAQHKDGSEYSEFIPFRVLEKLRVKSQNQEVGQLSNIWLEWTEEMYLAKAIKKVAKKLPLDDERVIEATILEDEPARLQEPQVQQQPQPQTLNTQVLPPKKEIGNLEKHYPDIINAGVKRNDLKDFIERYQLTDENIESFLTDKEGLKVMVEEFYNKEEPPI